MVEVDWVVKVGVGEVVKAGVGEVVKVVGNHLLGSSILIVTCRGLCLSPRQCSNNHTLCVHSWTAASPVTLEVLLLTVSIFLHCFTHTVFAHVLYTCWWICCRSVTAWRKWYHGARGQGGPFKAEGAPLVPPTPMKREDILDRYHQHVKSCPSCSKVGSRPLKCVFPMFVCGSN